MTIGRTVVIDCTLCNLPLNTNPSRYFTMIIIVFHQFGEISCLRLFKKNIWHLKRNENIGGWQHERVSTAEIDSLFSLATGRASCASYKTKYFVCALQRALSTDFIKREQWKWKPMDCVRKRNYWAMRWSRCGHTRAHSHTENKTKEAQATKRRELQTSLMKTIRTHAQSTRSRNGKTAEHLSGR